MGPGRAPPTTVCPRIVVSSVVAVGREARTVASVVRLDATPRSEYPVRVVVGRKLWAGRPDLLNDRCAFGALRSARKLRVGIAREPYRSSRANAGERRLVDPSGNYA
jgi:hypothetical protein